MYYAWVASVDNSDVDMTYAALNSRDTSGKTLFDGALWFWIAVIALFG
jgi:hypothetical protein